MRRTVLGGNCYCDTTCESYGDCCDDYVAACTASSDAAWLGDAGLPLDGGHSPTVNAGLWSDGGEDGSTGGCSLDPESFSYSDRGWPAFAGEASTSSSVETIC